MGTTWSNTKRWIRATGLIERRRPNITRSEVAGNGSHFFKKNACSLDSSAHKSQNKGVIPRRDTPGADLPPEASLAETARKARETEAELAELVEKFLPSEIGTADLNAALPMIYDELRELASACLRGERTDHTLQPTALVHESYLRLLGQHAVDWNNRLQFLSIAARMMRRILSNYASARAADKRGSGRLRLELDAALEIYDTRAVDIAKVDEALRGLEEMDPRQGRVVELRFFGGLTIEQTAEVLGLSVATVKRDWVTARRWLKREMSGPLDKVPQRKLRSR
jgi:RNA polymerase sigma factor (TIGR02999 family)